MSALEIALAKFARSAKLDALLPSSLRERLDVSTLPRLVDRMGVTKSVSVLLPFLLPETELPADLLATCGDANTQRQNVVHEGQRTIAPVVLIKQLSALRQLTELLLRHSSEAE